MHDEIQKGAMSVHINTSTHKQVWKKDTETEKTNLQKWQCSMLEHRFLLHHAS
jgi:hypothetical protein